MPPEAAIQRYQQIVAAGGWRPINGPTLKVGVRSQAVVARDRLIRSGDLDSQPPARRRCSIPTWKPG